MDNPDTPPACVLELGSGDGHTVSLLLKEVAGRGVHPSLVLMDRSERLLESARRDPLLSSARFVCGDLDSDAWAAQIGDMSRPALILAIFVLQELPQLRTLFDGLRDMMRANDRFVAVVPAPPFADRLTLTGALKLIDVAAKGDDWDWVGEYPIPTEAETLALPHFQRGVNRFEKAATDSGLLLVEHRYLQVPDTFEARKVFTNTAYGEGIIEADSSLLLTFTTPRP